MKKILLFLLILTLPFYCRKKVDEVPKTLHTVYYRLKTVDKDGKITYSPVKEVQILK